MSSSSADRPRSSFGQCRFFSGPKFAACVSQAVGLRIAVGHRRPVHLDERRARLDQAARQQQALAERVQAVALAHLAGVPSSDRRHRAPCRRAPGRTPCRSTRRRRNRSAPSRGPASTVDAFEQLEAVLQALRRDVLAQRQIVQLHRSSPGPDTGGTDRRPCRGSRRLPPLPIMPDSCSGRGSSTNGSTGSFGGFSFDMWLPAVGKSAGVGGSSWPEGEPCRADSRSASGRSRRCD